MHVLLAMDTLHQRPVILRNIDISTLNENAKQQAVQAAMHEYDELRHQHVPGVAPLIDLRYFQEHLYSVAGWPFPLPEDGNSKDFTHTLHDLLQSGIGLPGEQTSLYWLYQLCGTVAHLHNMDIVLGDLDPATLVLGSSTYEGVPVLSISWLPSTIRSLLNTTQSNVNEGKFVAPEARLGTPEPRSDIYSLGALLHLLLTGSTPDEQPSTQRSLPRLREANARISSSVEAIVMRALSFDAADRFQRTEEMEEALLLVLEQFSETRRARPGFGSQKNGKGGQVQPGQKDDADEVTISIVPLQSQLAHRHLKRLQANSAQNAHRDTIADTPTISTAYIRDALYEGETDTPAPVEDEILEDQMPSVDEGLPEPMPRRSPLVVEDAKDELPLFQRLQERITGVIPVFKPKAPLAEEAAPGEVQSDSEQASLLKRLQRFLLGEQQHTTTAAALIETPLRVQPNQGYTIRISLMGREAATVPHGSKKGTQPVGLSAIARNEIVHIEVRSAIFQNYAYVAQRADVQMPGTGFAAEVLIPMQTLSEGPSGRRERLHIFFMDEQKRPLYEKPFAIEVFVSRLVQSGREGHNVLTIPL